MNPPLGYGFFRLARNVSKYSNYPIKVGAVVVKKKPIGVGYNIKKTHPRFSNPENSIHSCIHAEMKAIMNCDLEVDGADMYIYRELKDGSPALARPCDLCYNVLKGYGIKTIYYSTNEFPYWRKERL